MTGRDGSPTAPASRRQMLAALGGTPLLHGTTVDAIGRPVGTKEWVHLGGSTGATSAQLTGPTVMKSPTPAWEHPGGCMPPAVVDGTVYNGRSGAIDAIRLADGKRVWSHTIGRFNRPLAVVDNRVLYTDRPDATTFGFGALARQNGTQQWYRTFDAHPGPIRVDTSQAYVRTISAVTAVDPDSGTSRWQTSLEGREVTIGGIGDRSLVVAVATPDSDDAQAQLVALHRETGSIVWTGPVPVYCGSVTNTPVVAGETVIIGGANQVCAYHIADGTHRWTARLGNGPIVAAPAIHAGTVYVADRAGNLYALALADGSRRWWTAVSSGVSFSPTVTREMVYLPLDTGTLAALERQTGTERWRYPFDVTDITQPVACHETLLINHWMQGSGSGRLTALRPESTSE